MSNEITIRNAASLPAAVSTEIRQLSTSPRQYLRDLPAQGIEADPPPNAIMLSQYRRGLNRDRQLLYLSMMIKEVNDFFNVRGNMSQDQMILTAELILDNPGFYDLTLGNIKACFRQKMMTAKLYDRIDGNLIIGWLREFKSAMADHCENQRIGQEREVQRMEAEGHAGAITHNAYMAMLEARANDGDEDARRILDDIRKRAAAPSPEEMRKKEIEFRKYRHAYLRDHSIIYGKKDDDDR